MNASTFLFPDGDGTQTLFTGPNRQPKTLLDDMTPAEREALSEWSTAQPGDAMRGGVIDLMQWPGWERVLTRRFKERFGVDVPKSSS